MMRPPLRPRLSSLLPALSLALMALLLSGCYTQLANASDRYDRRPTYSPRYEDPKTDARDQGYADEGYATAPVEDAEPLSARVGVQAPVYTEGEVYGQDAYATDGYAEEGYVGDGYYDEGTYEGGYGEDDVNVTRYYYEDENVYYEDAYHGGSYGGGYYDSYYGRGYHRPYRWSRWRPLWYRPAWAFHDPLLWDPFFYDPFFHDPFYRPGFSVSFSFGFGRGFYHRPFY
ncbi:MAG: hypothetical protein AAFQ53_12830, partial [Bacteroidota bacterium]